MAADAKVWHGAKALRRFLVPIEGLEPFPGNPRRGDVAQLRESLRRFGQVLPVLTDPQLGPEGLQRIVAHHHIVLAAAEEGWTHVAAIPNEFADEDEARAYLIADNRLGEVGSYDDEALVDQLRQLAEIDGLAATGYTTDDLDTLLAQLRAVPPLASPLERDGHRENRDPDQRELVLGYSTAQLDQLEIWMAIVSKEKSTAGTSETVYAALEIAARTLNQ